MRVLEIGGAPGAAARAVSERITPGGHIVVIDRSARGVALIERHSATEITAGLLSVRQTAAEEFVLQPGEEPFDLAYAIRVGALGGRHPIAGIAARARTAMRFVLKRASTSTAGHRFASARSTSKHEVR